MLARAGANLTRIDSAPLHGSPFEYEFLIEGILPPGMKSALSGSEGSEVRLIGRFPA